MRNRTVPRTSINIRIIYTQILSRKRPQPRVSATTDPLPPSDPDALAVKGEVAAKQLRRLGLEPIIVHLHQRGFTANQIAARLDRFYGFETTAHSVTYIINHLGDDFAVAAAQQEFAELHSIALEQLSNMRDEYRELSEQVKNAVLDAAAAKAANVRLEMLQRYFIQWWDRIGKFHFKADSVSLTANITQVSLVDALDKVKGKPAQAAAVLAELRGENLDDE